MKVVVTGGSGQLGTLVLRRLLDDRSVREIVSLDRRPPLAAGGAKLKVAEADVRDRDALARHFEGADAVIHLAFILVHHAERDVIDAVNVGGSENVFRAAVAAGAKTIVYASSVAAYGVLPGHPQPLVESSPRVFQADFAYSATKFQVEQFLDDFEREHPDVAIARLRPVVLVGRDMDHALGLAMRHRRLPDSGPTPLPLVWDEDVADAFVLALKKRARGAFNLAADDALPAAELARRSGLRVLGIPRAAIEGWARVSPLLEKLKLARRVDPAWVKIGNAPMVASSERAKKELGWSPRCPTNVAVIERFLKTAPRYVDPRIALFLFGTALAIERGLVEVDLSGFRSRIHLRLDGERGGDFTIAVDDGKLRIARGAPRPPTATVALDAPFFLDLLAGRADPASAQLTGKLRCHGEGHAALVVGGLITGFRAATSAAGIRGRATRAMRVLLSAGTRTAQPSKGGAQPPSFSEGRKGAR